MRLRRVKEWTKGRPAFPALMSAFIVVNADMIFGSMKLLAYDKKNSDKLFGSREWRACHREYAKLFCVDNIETWSRLYSHLLDDTSLEKFCETFADMPIISALPFFEAEVKKLTSLDDLNRPEVTEYIRTHLLDNFIVKIEESSVEERLRGLEPLFRIPFVTFTFKIFIPSVIYYQATPAVLMRQAIAGDREALCRLLQLDKNLLSIPELQAVWEPTSRDADSADFEELVRAMKGSPHRSLKPMRVKTAFALFIESLFRLMGQDISRTEIRDLFDCYAQDTKHANIDEDLPTTEDGFDAAIRREKKAWIEALEETTQQ